MSKSSTLSDQTKHLQDAVMQHAADIRAMIHSRYTQVVDIHGMVDMQITEWMDKLHVPDDLLTVPASLSDVHIHIKGLYETIQNLDTSDVYSYVDILHEAISIIKEILPKLETLSDGEQSDIFRTLDGLDDLAYDMADLLNYGFGDDAHTVAELATSIHITVTDLTDQMQNLGMSESTAQTIKSAVSPILNIIVMAAAHHKADEEEAYIKELQTQLSKEATYQRIFGADTERVIQNVNEKFDDIYTEVKEMPYLGALSTDKTDLQDVWKESITRFRSLDLEGYDDVEYAFDNLRENIDATFDFINKKSPHTQSLIDNTVRPLVLQWLTLPDDFRPNNYVEIIHVVVRNIQYSLRTSLRGAGPVDDFILPIVDKIVYILSQVDNDAFKLLITPKEDVEMHHIALPDLLPAEPQEKEQDKALPSGEPDTRPSPDASTDIDKETDLKPEKLTLDKVIDFLCFDKEYGATAKMEPVLADVIHDLYYRDWLGYRLDHLEDEIKSVFTMEKYQPIWEDIKAKLLDENGVNLGAFLDDLIKKVVSVINELITFVKDTIQYVIDEIFNLVKAIIQFFERVDLPAPARDFIKTIPLFKDMPDNVTILHVIAAIPYTLYREFISFEVPAKAEVAV